MNHSFEAECLLLTVPQPPHRAKRQLCKGVADHLSDVQQHQPSKHAPVEALIMLNQMGDNVNAHVQRLLTCSPRSVTS